MGMIADLYARLGVRTDKASFAQAKKSMNAVKAAVLGFAGFQAIKGITGMVEGVVDLGFRAKQLSQQLGLSTTSVQELSFAAKESGINVESLTGGLKKLSRGLVNDLAKGKGPVIDTLRTLGISSDAVKHKMSGQGGLDDILGLVSDKFAKMEDGPEKAGLAMKLFGRAGAELIPFLNKGSAGIEALRAKAHELGVVIDEKGIKALGDFKIKSMEMHAALQGLKQQAVVALVPALSQLVSGLTAWIAANRELLIDAITTAVQGLAYAFQALGFIVANVILPVFQFLKEHMDLTIAILITLGAFITAFAIQAAIDWAIAFWPFVLAGVAIAALVYAIRYLIKNWDKVKDAVRGAIGAIKDAISDFWHDLEAKGEAIMELFSKTIPNAIQGAWDALINWLTNKVHELSNVVNNNKLLHGLDLLAGGTNAKAAELGKQIEDAKAAAGAAKATGIGQPSAPGTESPAAPAAPARPTDGGPSASNVQIRGGDINLNVQGDPDAIGRAVKKHVDDQMTGMLLDAREVIS